MELTTDRGPFGGLYVYEIALLLMGVVLFGVAVWALVRAIRKDGSFIGPLSIFPFVLVFAGYPSVKAVAFGKEFSLVMEAARQDTGAVTSPDQRRKVEEAAASVLSRVPTPAARAAVANAYRATGDIDKAYAIASEVGAAQAAPEVKRELAPVFEAKLEATVSKAPEVQPDAAQREKIASVVRQLDAPGADLSAQAQVTLAQGYAALGDEAKANANLDQARAKQRDVRIDPRLLRRLQRPVPDGG